MTMVPFHSCFAVSCQSQRIAAAFYRVDDGVSAKWYAAYQPQFYAMEKRVLRQTITLLHEGVLFELGYVNWREIM